MNKLLKKKSLITILISFSVSLLMVILIFKNYSDFSETLISNEQKRLLAVADAIAKSIEENIDADQRFLDIIIKDKSFLNDLDSIKNNDDNMIGEKLATFIQVNSPRISRMDVYDNDGKSLESYSIDSEEQYLQQNQKEIEKVISSNEAYIGMVHFPSDEPPFFNIIVPIFNNDVFSGILSAQVDVNVIYDQIVQPVEIGTTGYASVKTDETRLLMHPNDDDIGLKLMEVRRDRFPEYDWSELEQVVNDQLENQRGVSIYHSVWAGDVNGTRVKKFSAFSSVSVGEHFWIVTISADYNEVVEVIRKNYYYTIAISAMIFISIIVAVLYLQIWKQRESKLKEKIKYLNKVELLNIELENDILQRKKLQSELVKSKDKYEAIFNSSKDCVILIDYEKGEVGGLIEFNSKTLEAFEYDVETLLSMSLNELDADQDIDMLNERLQTLNMDDSLLYESNIKSKHGKVTPYEFAATLFEIEEKKRILLIARDITLRKQEEQILIRSERRFLEIVNELASRVKDNSFEMEIIDYESNQQIYQKLEELNIQLEKLFKKEMDENRRKEGLMLMQSKNAAMGEMIGNIAHQWRQPLNTLTLILSNIQNELDYNKMSDEELEYFDSKFDKGARIIKKMSETIDDFRYFFKPQYVKQSFNLLETINGTIHLFDERLRLYGIELVVEGSENVSIYGFSNQLSQVVLNIINNSIDALIDNKILEPFVKILFEEDEDKVNINIIDNGNGINVELMDKIFNPYFTTKDESSGTGIGLYMSRTIIEKNFDGILDVTNTIDGARFNVQIPNKKENENV